MLPSNMLLRATLLATTLTLGACATSAPPTPGITHEGLEQVAGSSFDALYRKPGVEVSGYEAVGLAPCTVAFRNHWLRDQNRNRLDLSNRVNQRDVDRIKDQLSESCDAHLREALARAPAYRVVENFEDGQQVLLMRPSIINLDIAAPDVRSATNTRVYTTSAGEMTLVLDLVDATTGEVLARAVDRQRDMDSGYLQWTSSVTNKAEAERQLRRWAGRLREALDALRNNPAA